MKKLLVVMACAGALVVVGCGDKETPETFGKKYIEKKFENINCDLVDLDYTITEEGDDAATVLIEGKIKYKEEIQLVKKDGKWIVGKKAAKKEAAAVEAKEDAHAAPAKTEEHAAPAHEAPAAPAAVHH
ncbi:MAG: hypothetical protein KKD44_08925 [Proteobacteria bacterium]|nr:hypothetical protein [Pseudomonadota bacterium]